jgi:hypothetical protein
LGGGQTIGKQNVKNLIVSRYILIILITAFSIHSNAQGGAKIQADSCEVKLNGAHIKSYFSESWGVLKSPIRWRGKQWATAAVVSGVTVLIYTQDDKIRDFAQRNTTDELDQASKYFFEPLGSGIITIPLAVGFYAYGAIAKKQRATRVGLTSIKAMAITAVFTYAIKYATQRHRPYDDDPPNPRIWEGPFGSYSSTSFPSGHSSVIWAMATVFASEYRDKIWVPIVSYTLASLASASRVYDNEHWASDVVFGAALGFFIGKFVYKSTVKCPELVIIPGVSATGHPGFTMSYQLR